VWPSHKNQKGVHQPTPEDRGVGDLANSRLQFRAHPEGSRCGAANEKPALIAQVHDRWTPFGTLGYDAADPPDAQVDAQEDELGRTCMDARGQHMQRCERLWTCADDRRPTLNQQVLGSIPRGLT